MLLSHQTSSTESERYRSSGTMVCVRHYHHRPTVVVDTMNSKGFTLIELMVVVAIIGVLSAIAIPTYKDYTIRAKVSEAFVIIQPYKMKFVEYFLHNGVFPTKAKNSSIGMGNDGDCGSVQDCDYGVIDPSQYVSGIWIGGRVILDVDQDLVILFAEDSSLGDVSGQRIIFRAVNNGGSISWVCSDHHSDGGLGNPGPVQKYLPKSCQNIEVCPTCG